jgi:hypothetical protein
LGPYKGRGEGAPVGEGRDSGHGGCGGGAATPASHPTCCKVERHGELCCLYGWSGLARVVD